MKKRAFVSNEASQLLRPFLHKSYFSQGHNQMRKSLHDITGQSILTISEHFSAQISGAAWLLMGSRNVKFRIYYSR
jgi:hypothetical protein